MGGYSDRPWQASYPPGIPAELEPPAETVLDSFLATARRAPERGFIDDSGTRISYGAAEAAATAFAAALLEAGIGRGDRVAVHMQNRPEFAISQLGIWLAGAVQVPTNPMVRAGELEVLLEDSGAAALVTQADLWAAAGKEATASAGIGTVFSAGGGEGAADWGQTLRRFEGVGVPEARLRGADIAHIVYTSGTTGKPKGALNSHANVAFNAEVTRLWMSLQPEDVILGGAPLFHVTGLIMYLAAAYRSGCSIALFGRFDAERCLETVERARATFTVMSITAFIALLESPSIRSRDLSSLTRVCSGGAPVPAATVERWREVTGSPICNIYGLTETTSPSHLPASLGEPGPVDAASGTISVGLPVPSTEVRVVNPETLADAPVGEEGELWIRGPQVISGYWRRPEASAEALVDGFLRTGDVGRMDAGGFFYVVDRIKDMINASGFKVWPREVEDHLYEHPAIREAAVVGVPDAYRGETVKAFVSLKPGTAVTEAELVAFCRERMAAYKYPRLVEFLDEIPKNAAGKILRRELRERGLTTSQPVNSAPPGSGHSEA